MTVSVDPFVPPPSGPGAPPRFRDLFTPKLVTALREGYSLEIFRHDAIAGLTVAIVALPLAMAIAIASGAPPERGLVTAIIAGFLISALGGSRHQIGGPTAAFIVVVYNVIARHGYDGMVLATLMAGLILIAVGLFRLGTYIKYIPYPVVVGFTSGIAVSIFMSQIKELLGFEAALPGDFWPRVRTIVAALPTSNPAAIAVAALSIGTIVALKRWRPHWPAFLIAVGLSALVVALLPLDAATIGTRFGGVPSTLPPPKLPAFDLDKMRAVLPDAVTIAFLAGIESLLSAVVADGMTGRRHRSNCELVAQGIANIASGLFGGLSATGAIARTATNIRSGGRTPVAGILHAAFLLVFMLVAAPMLSYVPLAALAAVLTVVAWNISEPHQIHQIVTRAPMGDRVVFILTFLLTVLVDLTIAIEVGVVLAALLFMHRMANAVEIETHIRLLDEDVADDAPRALPLLGEREGEIVYRINGPFFFGATQTFASALDRIGEHPKAIVLDFSAVPFIDSTGATALRGLVEKVHAMKGRVVFASVAPPLRRTLEAFGVTEPAVEFRPSP